MAWQDGDMVPYLMWVSGIKSWQPVAMVTSSFARLSCFSYCSLIVSVSLALGKYPSVQALSSCGIVLAHCMIVLSSEVLQALTSRVVCM